MQENTLKSEEGNVTLGGSFVGTKSVHEEIGKESEKINSPKQTNLVLK